MAKYLSSEDACNVQISEEVITAIVAIAACDVEGVVPAGAKNSNIDWKDLLPKKGFGKNVRVESPEGKLVIDVDISVEYGDPSSRFRRTCRKRCSTRSRSQTGLKVGSVNVHVSGILFPKKKPE